MIQGYYLVDPGLLTHGLFSNPEPELRLSNDDCVRCLSYIVNQADVLTDSPYTVKFKVIVAEYTSGPWACIGMYEEIEKVSPEILTDYSLRLEDKVADYIRDIGIPKLRELAAGETLTWDDLRK